MDVSKVLTQLSSPLRTDESDAAARKFLSEPAPSELFERVYTWLVWQRTLLVCMRHLEAAGADLSQLIVSNERFKKTFRGWRSPWSLDTDNPVSAKELVDIYALHRRLLTEQMTELLDAGGEGLALVSGRAYQVRYPDYTARVEFDTDVVAPDLAVAAAMAGALAGGDSALDTVRIRRLGPTPDAIVEIRASQLGHRVSLGVLVGGYHAHRGAILERSTTHQLCGRRVAVASAEDLLLMLAARVERKRRFGLVNVNDASEIVRQEPDLDWDYVVRTAERFVLAPTLVVILEKARELRDAPLVLGWAADLAAGRGRSSAVSIARRVAEADLSFGEAPLARRDRKLWLAELAVRRQRRDEQGLLSRLRVRIEEKVLSAQLDRSESGEPVAVWERAATSMRRHSGTLCESIPDMAGGANCMAARGRWASSRPQPLLAEAAAAFKDDDGLHDCDRYRFALAAKEGT